MEAWRLTGISKRSCLFQLLEWNIYRISMNRIKPSTPRLFFTPSLRALHHPSFQVVTISSQVMIHIVTTLLGWWSCMLAVFLATVQSTLPNNPKTGGSSSEKAEINTPRSTSRNVQKKWKCVMKTRRENVFKPIMGRAISTLECTPRLNDTCTNMSKDVYVYTQTQKAVVIGYDTHSAYITFFTNAYT